MARRGYPAEFRRRVVDLVEGGRKVSEVATELGVSEQTIYVWRRQARIDAGLEAGVTTSEFAERAAAHATGRDVGAAPSVPARDLPPDRSRDMSRRCFVGRGAGLRRPRHRDLRELPPADLLEQQRDRPSQDAREIPVRDLVAHQRAKLLQLGVQLPACGEADAIALAAER